MKTSFQQKVVLLYGVMAFAIMGLVAMNGHRPQHPGNMKPYGHSFASNR